MRYERIITLLALLAVTAAPGCFKKVSYDTLYVVKPLVQSESGGVPLAVPGAVAYAFDVDTAQWTVATYADALAGILTPKEGTAAAPAPAAVSQPFEMDSTENWICMQVSAPSLMVLVVDTQDRLYGYRQQALAENLSPMYVSAIFRPWKEGTFYIDGTWRMFNEFYVAPEPDVEDPEDPDQTEDPENPDDTDDTDDPADPENPDGTDDPDNPDDSGETDDSDETDETDADGSENPSEETPAENE